MKVDFFKYQGTGNDFILIDNRDEKYSGLTQIQIKQLCSRHTGIGADGLMLFNLVPGFDFEMKYYNADGKESTMCGNGGRCIVKFAAFLGIQKDHYQFKAIDGGHEAEIDNNGIIRLKMIDIHQVEIHTNHFILDTGSPHYIKYVDEVENYDVYHKGLEIRNSSKYKPNGINVNFVEKIQDGEIYVRTFERGVEDETLSCGTGVTAAAIVSAHNDNGFNIVNVKTRGGKLTVEFEKHDEDHFDNIWLCGPAVFVFNGSIIINN